MMFSIRDVMLHQRSITSDSNEAKHDCEGQNVDLDNKQAGRKKEVSNGYN